MFINCLVFGTQCCHLQIMLNILEDYLIASGISYGRIDGSIQGNLRQKVGSLDCCREKSLLLRRITRVHVSAGRPQFSWGVWSKTPGELLGQDGGRMREKSDESEACFILPISDRHGKCTRTPPPCPLPRTHVQE